MTPVKESLRASAAVTTPTPCRRLTQIRLSVNISKDICSNCHMCPLPNRLKSNDVAGGFLSHTHIYDHQKIDGRCSRTMFEILKGCTAG